MTDDASGTHVRHRAAHQGDVRPADRAFGRTRPGDDGRRRGGVGSATARVATGVRQAPLCRTDISTVAPAVLSMASRLSTLNLSIFPRTRSLILGCVTPRLSLIHISEPTRLGMISY